MNAISYSLSFEKAKEHLISVTLTIDKPDPNGQVLEFATWIPGSYLIREFAKDIVTIQAFSKKKPIGITKLNKNTFLLEKAKGPIRVLYDVYCFDTSVRTAFVDTSRVFFNGTSVFFNVKNQTELPYIIDIKKPKEGFASNWRVATALAEKDARRYKFGTYIAKNFDELIDCPVEIGDFILEQFKAQDCVHDIVISGTVTQLNRKQLTNDFKKIADTTIQLFEPKTKKAPVNRFVFLITSSTDEFGGLEHRSSCVLLCPRDCFPTHQKNNEHYTRLLSLTAHEYFHTWWVKRVKPASFHPYDISNEIDTSLLWIFEGFTTYYESLILLRAGLISKEDFLKALLRIINIVSQNTAYQKQSLSHASSDTWIKFYRQNENAPNALTNYYTKGALIALDLDCCIRVNTNHAFSLDHVLRQLWKKFGRDFYNGKPQGIDENTLKDVLTKLTSINWDDYFNHCIHDTFVPNLTQPLKHLGISLKKRWDSNINLRIRTKLENNQTIITHVLDFGCAQKAGLCPKDIIVAIDNIRVEAYGESSLSALLSRYKLGDKITMHVFRNNVLKSVDIVLENNPLPFYQLRFIKKKNEKIQRAQALWFSKTN